MTRRPKSDRDSLNFGKDICIKVWWVVFFLVKSNVGPVNKHIVNIKLTTTEFPSRLTLRHTMMVIEVDLSELGPFIWLRPWLSVTSSRTRLDDRSWDFFILKIFYSKNQPFNINEKIVFSWKPHYFRLK